MTIEFLLLNSELGANALLNANIFISQIILKVIIFEIQIISHFSFYNPHELLSSSKARSLTLLNTRFSRCEQGDSRNLH